MMSTRMYPLPDVERALVLAPHPDDEALGCGGTIALYASMGVDVCLIVVSDGGKISADKDIDIIEIRKKEAINASKLLGIKQTHFLAFPDGELASNKDKIKEKIENIIEGFNPQIVFSPSPMDHEDHMTVSEITLSLLRNRQALMAAFYEVYGTVRFNVLVDITDVMDLKKKAILEYRHSLFLQPDIFYEAIRGLNRFRAFFTREKRFYEAFWLVSKPIDNYQVIDWFTYGMREGDPAVVFLSKIKDMDELLFELKKCNDVIISNETEIYQLRDTVEDRERKIEELKMKLDRISDSLAWKAVTAFYEIRDKILPEKSVLRSIYEHILSRIKASLK